MRWQIPLLFHVKYSSVVNFRLPALGAAPDSGVPAGDYPNSGQGVNYPR